MRNQRELQKIKMIQHLHCGVDKLPSTRVERFCDIHASMRAMSHVEGNTNKIFILAWIWEIHVNKDTVRTTEDKPAYGIGTDPADSELLRFTQRKQEQLDETEAKLFTEISFPRHVRHAMTNARGCIYNQLIASFISLSS